ncbi:MAG: hypothetical protein AB7S38_38825 [Vulcanimicrobiota bacterium]
MKPLQENTHALEPEALHHMARRASTGLVIHRIILGRCLLALQVTGRYQDFGCSGPIHYAIRLLGVTKKEANACRRVARQLEALPQLTAAAERGDIGWAKLRESQQSHSRNRKTLARIGLAIFHFGYPAPGGRHSQRRPAR